MRGMTVSSVAMMLFALTTFATSASQAGNPTSAPVEQNLTSKAPSVSTGPVAILPLYPPPGNARPPLGVAISADIQIAMSGAARQTAFMPANSPPVNNEIAARDIARQQAAATVIFGEFQLIGDQIHVTLHVLDIRSEKPGNTIVANGSVNNIFPLEDEITKQLLDELAGGNRANIHPTSNSATQPTHDSSEIYPILAADLGPATQQYYSYTYPDYSATQSSDAYNYGPYPYYWYSVPYYGSGFFFYGDWDLYHHHYWHNGWDGWHGHESAHGIPHGAAHSAASHAGGGFHGGGGGAHGGGGGHR